MNHNAGPETKTQEYDGQSNSVSARVIGLVTDESSTFRTDTGVYRRQSHSKEGKHIFVAYNPHGGQWHSAECFVIATPSDKALAEKYNWLAAEGPSPEDSGKINQILDEFESIVLENG